MKPPELVMVGTKEIGRLGKKMGYNTGWQKKVD